MFRTSSRTPQRPVCFPRVRGDVPEVQGPLVVGWSFSPRARGCSGVVSSFFSGIIVFPACAGMFPRPLANATASLRFPRVRGDVPQSVAHSPRASQFSPRARGCSDHAELAKAQLGVFPACAGMFRSIQFWRVIHSGFPRVRGDVP